MALRLAGAGRFLSARSQCVAGRTPFAFRTAGDGVRTLANDVLPGGLDLSGVQDVSPVNQFVIVPQKTWTEHVTGARHDDARQLSRARRQTLFSRGGPAELHHQRAGCTFRSRRVGAAAIGPVAQRCNHHRRARAAGLRSRLFPGRRHHVGLSIFRKFRSARSAVTVFAENYTRSAVGSHIVDVSPIPTARSQSAEASFRSMAGRRR